MLASLSMASIATRPSPSPSKFLKAGVLRTEEMNAPEEDTVNSTNAAQPAASSAGAKVLLAAFSRPPAARAEDVEFLHPRCRRRTRPAPIQD